MHPALWQLLWLDTRGVLRSIVDVRKNWRQLGLLLLMLLFVGAFVAVRVLNPTVAQSGRFGSAMPFWALIYLLATWLTASADRGLVMRPAEIHFIVGGPFRNRDVITLNLVRLAFRAFFSALVLALLAAAYVPSFPAALLGIWLLIAVSLLVGMVASLTARTAQPAVVKRLRRAFSLLALAAFIGLIAQAMQMVRNAGEVPQFSTVAATAIETPIGQWLLPPLAWMFAPLSADNFFPAALSLVPPRLLVIAAFVLSIYLLGSRYAEASAGRTDQSIAKRQTALRSGIAGGAAQPSWTKRLSVPSFGSLGGIGPVAWMQMTHSVRILPRYLLFTTAIVGVVLVLPLMVDANRLRGWGTVSWMTGLTMYADFLLLLQLPVGFLGPVAQRERLKALPIPSWRIVVGQLAGPLIPLAAVHALVTILFATLQFEQLGRVLMLSAALVPASLVIVANINLLGVWGIIRPKALQQRDALAAGRAMASVWIFFAMLTPAIIAAALVGAISSILVGDRGPEIQFIATVMGASLGAFVSSFGYIALLARAFRTWQPSSREGGSEETEYDR